MSVKINKNGKEYPLGFVPQSLYDDVEELKENVFRGSVSVTADGMKTLSVLYDELYALVDRNKITPFTCLENSSSTLNHFMRLVTIEATEIQFSSISMDDSHTYGNSAILKPSGSVSYYNTDSGTPIVGSSGIPVAGKTYTIYY